MQLPPDDPQLARPADKIHARRFEVMATPGTLASATPEQMLKMERVMAILQTPYRLVEHSCGQDVLHFGLAKGHLTELLEKARVARFLKLNQPEVLEQSTAIVNSSSLDPSSGRTAAVLRSRLCIREARVPFGRQPVIACATLVVRSVNLQDKQSWVRPSPSNAPTARPSRAISPSPPTQPAHLASS
jgi:hypothetical protein